MLVPPSRLSYFLKLIFVLVLISTGLLSFLKETSFFNQRPKLSQNQQRSLTEKIFPNSLVANSLVPKINFLTNNATGDYVIKVPILTYHHIRSDVPLTEELTYGYSVSPAVLDQQLSFLANNSYQTISLNDLNDSLENTTPVPPKSVILTFDDGYRDFYTLAFPLLKKYNLRAVVFYIVGYFNYPSYMTWNMLAEIHNSGLVDVESHTLEHPLLTKIDSNEAKREIFESKKILEQKLNKKIKYFAYPYGNYDERVVNLVKEAGYNLAFGTLPGSTLRKSARFILHRVGISGFDSFEQFKTKLNN